MPPIARLSPRPARMVPALLSFVLALAAPLRAADPEGPSRGKVLETMRRAAGFMVEKASVNGGYVWNCLPDQSRRWGELEARESMIWIQPPGTATMGHLFLDAYHATGDEYYYQAAAKAADALIRGQHPSGGWNYVVDFAGEESLKRWYETVGRNAWRLEEFQHYYGNATFDDSGTAESSKFLLRIYVEKRDPKYRPALDRAIRFVLDSQYPSGGWPQRFPLKDEFHHHGRPDYTSFITLNDDVASENIDFLILCHSALGDASLLDPIHRAMDCFLLAQGGPEQPGWALQYTRDMKPAGARTYEPEALATHTTAEVISSLLKFYRMTGDARYIARIPEALDWLDKVRLPKELEGPGRTHPTFIELGTNRPIYLHRRGTNVFNGEYYTDRNPEKTVGHYSSFRQIDTVSLRAEYEKVAKTPVAELTRDSVLLHGSAALPKYFLVGAAGMDRRDGPARLPASLGSRVSRLTGSITPAGYWLSPLRMTSHPYTHDGDPKRLSDEANVEIVGDATDTSPYFDSKPQMGISTAVFVHNMSQLIEYLDQVK